MAPSNQKTDTAAKDASAAIAISPLSADFCIEQVNHELKKGSSLSIIRLVDLLIQHASAARASDIHLDPSHEGVRVRLRVDGVLQEMHKFPLAIHPEIIARIKILCSMRTDEHQAPQDGRFRYSFAESKSFIDIRVSIVPTYHGENVVMRLLSDNDQHFTLETLGFSKADQEKIQKAIKKPNGMILATGPTGSGKTTTLYTLVKMLSAPEVSIVTIEDPIEYAVENIEQIQVNPRSGLSFANGLRTILRQDPDIIMVGEIRDAETASIAVNTALTGHLLLSTLHTNDAATTLPRLLDMGIDTYLVASTVNIAIGQRLVRKICTFCRQKETVTQAVADSLAATTALKEPIKAGMTLYRGAGCVECNNSGYSGRLSINEVIVCDSEIREAILRKAPSDELKSIAVKNGMTTMLEDGFAKVRKGETTAEEVLRVVYE
jgi:type II secretory ATPase GspE/PulE/Tfp pilus assembly ATPase PilB-like protein